MVVVPGVVLVPAEVCIVLQGVITSAIHVLFVALGIVTAHQAAFVVQHVITMMSRPMKCGMPNYAHQTGLIVIQFKEKVPSPAVDEMKKEIARLFDATVAVGAENTNDTVMPTARKSCINHKF